MKFKTCFCPGRLERVKRFGSNVMVFLYSYPLSGTYVWKGTVYNLSVIAAITVILLNYLKTKMVHFPLLLPNITVNSIEYCAYSCSTKVVIVNCLSEYWESCKDGVKSSPDLLERNLQSQWPFMVVYPDLKLSISSLIKMKACTKNYFSILSVHPAYPTNFH